MYLLDTNVLSDMMSRQPTAAVVAWISAQPGELLFTAAPCKAEILAGIAVLPNGRRRSALAAAADAMFSEDFEGRVLPFDDNAAGAYADAYAARRRIGLATSAVDLMIAAIARCYGASVVTRNAVDFSECGIEVIDPWQPEPSTHS